MDFANAANLIQQSVAQNNAWSAEQAQKQMDFQERMSNTAHQREIADLRAAGLNPVLSAKLAGASTPSGAMGGTDTSGTSALIELLSLAMETANSAAGAAAAAAGSRGSSSDVLDNAAGNLKEVRTTADVFGMTQDANGDYKFDKESKSKLNEIRKDINNVLYWIPGGNVAAKAVNWTFNHLESGINKLNKAYSFNSAKEAQLEANRRRLQVDNHKNSSTSSKKAFGGR